MLWPSVPHITDTHAGAGDPSASTNAPLGTITAFSPPKVTTPKVQIPKVQIQSHRAEGWRGT